MKNKLLEERKIIYLKMFSFLSKRIVAVFLLLIFSTFFMQILYSQTNKFLSIDEKQIALPVFFSLIEKQSDYLFFYIDADVKDVRVDIKVVDKTLPEILSESLMGTGLSYKISGKNVSIIREVEEKDKKNRTLKGKVLDEEGEPIVGANIRVKGSSLGYITDENGNFFVDRVTDKTILQISYIGYRTQEVKVDKNIKLTIKLEEDTQAIDEFVVVGYGTQKKESLTGAISNLDSKEIIKTKAPSLAQAIQGKIAGLRIRQENGEPGRFSSNINIRGFGTPLFIIDGVVRDGANEFQRLNSDDIESISFLKDATAAIYGMNSANGAVIITTKKGKSSKPRLTLNAYTSFSSPTDVPKMANAAQYMTMRNEAELNAGKTEYLPKEELAKYQQAAPGYRGLDLYDAVFDNYATQHQGTLSVDGASDKATYYGSIGYMSDNSLLKNNALVYDKYSFRSNVSLKINKNLTASINVGGRYDKTKRPFFSFFEIFKSTRVNPPITSIFANDRPGKFNSFSYVPNPAAIANPDYSGGHEEQNKVLQSQFSLEYSLPWVKGLKVKTSLAYDYDDFRIKAIKKSFNTYSYDENTGDYSSIEINKPSLIRENRLESRRLDFQTQTMYNKAINDDHNIAATYVFEVRKNDKNWLDAERKFDFFTIGELNNASETDQRVSGSSEEQRFLSHIGRVIYDFRGKYLLEAAFRYDGSYRYFAKKRWAFFPSASLGWRMSEESFIKDNLGFIDNLKLRASIGRSGADAGDPFQYFPGYRLNVGGYVFEEGVYTKGIESPTMVNKYLTWVNANIYNVGIDFSILNRLISLEFDIYQRDRDGLLADRYGSLPNTFGSKLPQENLNSDRTRGIEFTLSHENKVGDFRYTVSSNFNLARTKNRYVEGGPHKSSMERWRHQRIDRWGDFIWGFQTDGRFENFDQINTSSIQNGDFGNSKELPGDFIIKDVNGDGVINDQDKVPLFWSGTPQIFFGFNLQASWKNFDLYALFQGAALYTVQFDEVYARMLCFKGGNTPEYFYDRWHKADPSDSNSAWIPGEWPAIRLEQDMGAFYTRDSDIWRRDASYVRLKTIEIGYTFNPNLLKTVGVDGLRIYVNGNNLLTICDPFVKPFDPEKIEGVHSAGLNYPLNKSFNLGLTLNF